MAKLGRPPKLNRPIRDPDFPNRADPPRQPVNFDLLTEEDRARIRADAEARVTAREKERAEEAYLELQELKVRKERNPEAFEEEVDYIPDLAIYCSDGLRVDGRVYEHGRTYRVKASVAASLREMAQRTHRHEAEVQSGDPYNSFYSRQRYKDMEAQTAYANISAKNGITTHNGAPVKF